MFTVKICGVTTVDDARMVAEAGADAIGINFYASSPRFVPAERAAHLAAALPPRIVKVGLFVDAPAEAICGLYDALGLQLIQLHGDEPPEFLAELGGRPVMKAFRVGSDVLAPVAEYLAACHALKTPPLMVLLDAHRPGQYGGTGATADWAMIAREKSKLGYTPIVLAGGLTADNVAAAIAAAGPVAVDTASGVELSPGHKDAALTRRFVTAARAAFAESNDAPADE